MGETLTRADLGRVAHVVGGVHKARRRRRRDLSMGGELPERQDRIGVAEELLVCVVGVPAGGVDHPPGCLEGDPVGVGDVDRAHDLVIDHLGDLAPVLCSASRACSSGRLKDTWSNWTARRSGTPAGLANGSISASRYSKNATVCCGPNSKK
jgi:hypothetical protein